MEEVVLFLGYIGIILSILVSIIVLLGTVVKNSSLVFLGSLIATVGSFTWIYRFNLLGDWQAAVINYLGLAINLLYVFLMIIALITGNEKFNVIIRKE
jgi:uncharacterized membrane protein YphA (DoxX/SURF4 family)